MPCDCDFVPSLSGELQKFRQNNTQGLFSIRQHENMDISSSIQSELHTNQGPKCICQHSINDYPVPVQQQIGLLFRYKTVSIPAK